MAQRVREHGSSWHTLTWKQASTHDIVISLENSATSTCEPREQVNKASGWAGKATRSPVTQPNLLRSNRIWRSGCLAGEHGRTSFGPNEQSASLGQRGWPGCCILASLGALRRCGSKQQYHHGEVLLESTNTNCRLQYVTGAESKPPYDLLPHRAVVMYSSRPFDTVVQSDNDAPPIERGLERMALQKGYNLPRADHGFAPSEVVILGWTGYSGASQLY